RSDPAGIAVDPTGIMLAVYEKNGSILLLWANGSSIRRFPAAGGGIVAATFNPQGSRLAAAYADGTIRLWRTRPDLAVTKADLQVTRSAYVVNVTLENIGSIAAASTTLRVGGTEVPVPAIPPAGDFAYRRAIPRNSAEGIRLTRDRGVAIVADSSRTSLEDTFANNRRFLRLAATNVTGSGVRSKIVAAATAGSSSRRARPARRSSPCTTSAPCCRSARTPSAPNGRRTTVASQQPSGPGSDHVPTAVVVVLCVTTALVAMLFLYTLWAWWPDVTSKSSTQPVNWFGWHLQPKRETLFFLTVALSGALGGLIHTIRSLSWYVGNRDFRWSWVPFNLMLP